MTIRAMLETHPAQPGFDLEALGRCIAACFDCAQTCTTCADACLSEDDPASQRACIRRCQDCADICAVTGRLLSRLSEAHQGLLSKQLEACREACLECAEECERHAAHMEHCRVCAEACRACEDACAQLLN